MRLPSRSPYPTRVSRDGPLEIGGRRECRALDAPAASRGKWKTREFVTTVTPETSGIPRAMVLTVSFVLSPVTGLFVTASVMRKHYRRTPASGHQDHTTSPSAMTPLVGRRRPRP